MPLPSPSLSPARERREGDESGIAYNFEASAQGGSRHSAVLDRPGATPPRRGRGLLEPIDGVTHHPDVAPHRRLGGPGVAALDGVHDRLVLGVRAGEPGRFFELSAAERRQASANMPGRLGQKGTVRPRVDGIVEPIVGFDVARAFRVVYQHGGGVMETA